MSWILSIFLAAGWALTIWVYKSSSNSIEYYKKHRDMLQEELKAKSEALRSQTELLNTVAGGVGKRISECREITETIHKLAPDIFLKDRALIHRLSATDEFLVELHKAMPSDPKRERLVKARSDQIYTDIYQKFAMDEEKAAQ